MSLSIDNDCKLILYADDSAILFYHKCVDIGAILFFHKCVDTISKKKLGKVLESCSSWLIDNKLS